MICSPKYQKALFKTLLIAVPGPELLFKSKCIHVVVQVEPHDWCHRNHRNFTKKPLRELMQGAAFYDSIMTAEMQRSDP
jgi:hypothetical protein